jgi:hypothetical protein
MNLSKIRGMIINGSLHTSFVEKYDYIFIEDFIFNGYDKAMGRNDERFIACFHSFLNSNMLPRNTGVKVHKIDRWFASSKTMRGADM